MNEMVDGGKEIGVDEVKQASWAEVARLSSVFKGKILQTLLIGDETGSVPVFPMLCYVRSSLAKQLWQDLAVSFRLSHVSIWRNKSRIEKATGYSPRQETSDHSQKPAFARPIHSLA